MTTMSSLMAMEKSRINRRRRRRHRPQPRRRLRRSRPQKGGEQGGRGLRCGPCLSCLGAGEEEEMGEKELEGKVGDEEEPAAAAPVVEPPKVEAAGR